MKLKCAYYLFLGLLLTGMMGCKKGSLSLGSESSPANIAHPSSTTDDQTDSNNPNSANDNQTNSNNPNSTDDNQTDSNNPNSTDDNQTDSNNPNSANDNQTNSDNPNSTNDNQDDKNRKTTINFRAFSSSDSSNISDLKKRHLVLKEGRVTVKNYKLSRRSRQTQLELVFVLDVTGSMGGEIQLVKDTITDFVYDLSLMEVQAKLCLVTFLDVVKKKCEAFVNDNPSTIENENLSQFLDDINKEKATGGGAGNENSLGGLLSAIETTPWGKNNQRMAVLITDAPFWDSPEDILNGKLRNPGEANTAPSYSDVLNALDDKGVQVFAITPDEPGFSQPYTSLPLHPGLDIKSNTDERRGPQPSVVDYTGGKWFNLANLKSDEENINDIFDYIAVQVQTFYKIEYFSNKNPGITANIVKKRKISLKPRKNNNSSMEIKIQNIHSKIIK